MAARKPAPGSLEALLAEHAQLEHQLDTALVREADADIKAQARAATLAPLNEYRRLRKEASDVDATRYFVQNEAAIAAARALEREPAEPPKPTKAAKEAAVIASVQQRNADARAVNAYRRWAAEENQVVKARLLTNEVLRGRELANETKDDSGPEAA